MGSSRAWPLVIGGLLALAACGNGQDGGAELPFEDTGEQPAAEATVVFDGEALPIDSVACNVVEGHANTFAYWNLDDPTAEGEVSVGEGSGGARVVVDVRTPEGDRWEFSGETDDVRVSGDGAFGTATLIPAGTPLDERDEAPTAEIELDVPCPS
jgi:hypothetical protein